MALPWDLIYNTRLKRHRSRESWPQPAFYSRGIVLESNMETFCKGGFWGFFGSLFNTASSTAFRFLCVGGCWDWTQDCCKCWHWQSNVLTLGLDLIHMETYWQSNVLTTRLDLTVSIWKHWKASEDHTGYTCWIGTPRSGVEPVTSPPL